MSRAIIHFSSRHPDGAVIDQSEETRLRYRYRDLVLRGKVRLPLAGARALVGPDCAYHLYSRTDRGDGGDPTGE